MTADEQIEICRRLAVTCMWGQGGIASVFLEGLQKSGIDAPRPWREVYEENAKQAKRDSMGVITDRDTLQSLLRRGFWLVNYDEDGCALFYPPPMNGLCKYVSKELAASFPRPETTTRTVSAGLASLYDTAKG